MKTLSQLLNRPSLDVAEVVFRAGNNDLVFGRADAYLDQVRPLYPQVKYMTYALHRYAIPSIAADWDTYATNNGINKEVAFIHHSGVRRIDGTGWYVMNMGSSQYLQWRRTRTLLAILGVEFDQTPHATGPMDACDYDLVLWYPEFDSAGPGVPVGDDPNPCVLQSTEYAGTGNLYQDHCKADFLATKAFILASGAPTTKIYPNFGSMGDAQRPDANTLAVINACDGFRCETTVRYNSAGRIEIPNATDAISRWNFIDEQCGLNDKEIFAHGWIEQPPNGVAKAKIGTSAFFLMADNDKLHGRFASNISEPPLLHISTWEHNDLMRSASLRIGRPIAVREEVGSWTQGRLFKRVFERGEVWIYLQKIEMSGDDTANAFLSSPLYPLDENGLVLEKVSSISLGIGEAKILWTGEYMAQATLQLTGTGLSEWAPTPGGTPDADHYTLVDEPMPGDDTDYVTNGGHINGFIEEFLMEAGPPNDISKVTNVNLNMLFSGLAVTNVPAFRVQIVVGGAVVGSREFSADTAGLFEEASINIPVAVLGSDWYAGPRIIRFIPIDGNAGYGGIPHEVD